MKAVKKHQSWFSLGIVWAGAVISIPSLLVGNALVAGMGLSTALLVTLAGYAIIVLLMILQGIQSTDLGKPTVQVAAQVFGKTGSRTILSIILAIACLGWFGIQANVCGAALADLLAKTGVNMPVPLASLICGFVMVISAVYGVKVLRVISYIAVPLLVGISIFGLIEALTGDSCRSFSIISLRER